MDRSYVHCYLAFIPLFQAKLQICFVSPNPCFSSKAKARVMSPGFCFASLKPLPPKKKGFFYFGICGSSLAGVGAAALLLLFIGIHNAWDSVAYHVFVSKRDTDKKGRRDEASKKDTL